MYVGGCQYPCTPLFLGNMETPRLASARSWVVLHSLVYLHPRHVLPSALLALFAPRITPNPNPLDSCPPLPGIMGIKELTKG